MSLKNISLKYSDGTNYNLQDYEDFIILITNTASECGLAPQLEELEKLYQKYKDQKFVVLAFPSDQFKQEPLKNEEMKNNYEEKHGITFPINEKVEINGKNAAPIFKWAKQEQGGVGKSIKWNFTKFLINRNGEVVDRFAPTTKPSKIEQEIKKLL